MKILLTTLNSKYVHSNLALRYLYAAGIRGFEGLTLQEFTINNSRDYVFTELVTGEYDVVFFSCYIWNIRQTLELAEDLKRAQPTVKIVLGGPEVSYDAKDVLSNHKSIDFIIAGEGEYAFVLLCSSFEGQLNHRKVPGLVYRGEDEIVANPPAMLPFEKVSFPYELVPCEENKIIYYESSRGCPYKCSYCISSLDRKLRTLPIPRVKEEIKYFLYKNVKQVKFVDRTFNWDKRRAIEILEYIVNKDMGRTNFHFEICGDLLDEEFFQVVKRARKGLFQFEVGIQTTNEKSLEAVDRRTDIEQVLYNVKTLVEMENCHVHTDLIAGLPFEYYVTFQQSFDQVYDLGAQTLQLGFLKLLKGTKIREDAEKYGYEYMSEAPYEVIRNHFMTATQISRLKQIETVLDLYYNRGGFEKTLAYILERLHMSPFKFYEAFADYYYRMGYQHSSHKKEDQYRILYQFIHTITKDETVDRMLEQDLENTMNFDAVKKFKRKGWNILQVEQ